MAGKVETTLYDTYLLVHVKGDPLSPEEIAATWRKVLGQATESSLDIIIFQESAVELRPSTLRLHSLTNFLGVSEFKNRLALVAPKEMYANEMDRRAGPNPRSPGNPRLSRLLRHTVYSLRQAKHGRVAV